MSKRVFFVCYGGGHVSMVLPVIRELERLHPEIDCVLMALTTGHQKACAVRPTLGYRDFWHLVDSQAARAWGDKLSQGNTSPDVPADETLAYMGINYLDLISQHGEAGAAELYRKRGRYAFMPLYFMRRVLEELAPGVVVATNSPRSEQAVLEEAKAMGIPSVGILDLFGQDTDPYVTRAIKPDWTCVISEVVRERLIARDFAADSVLVTGNPAFDGLFSPENREKANQYILDRGWEGLKPVLWAGHTEPSIDSDIAIVSTDQSLPLEVEAVLREHTRRRTDIALTVRYHPGDWHTYPRLPDQARVHFSEPPREPIHPIILASSVVVVQTSTVGLEAAVVGKPAISIENSPAAHKWVSFARQGVTIPCPTPADLPGVLDQILEGGAEQPTNAYGSDGEAAKRVASVVRNACRALA